MATTHFSHNVSPSPLKGSPVFWKEASTTKGKERNLLSLSLSSDFLCISSLFLLLENVRANEPLEYRQLVMIVSLKKLENFQLLYFIFPLVLLAHLIVLFPVRGIITYEVRERGEESELLRIGVKEPP